MKAAEFNKNGSETFLIQRKYTLYFVK